MFTYVWIIFFHSFHNIFIVTLCMSSENNVEKRRKERIGGEQGRRGERIGEGREKRGKRREEKGERSMYVTCLLSFLVLGLFLCVVFVFFSGEVVWLCA